MVYKPELIDRVWSKLNIGKQERKERIRKVDIELIINEFLKNVSRCMIDGEDVLIRNFGNFVSNIRKGRIAFDSINRQLIRLPERRVIKLMSQCKLIKIYLVMVPACIILTFAVFCRRD